MTAATTTTGGGGWPMVLDRRVIGMLRRVAWTQGALTEAGLSIGYVEPPAWSGFFCTGSGCVEDQADSNGECINCGEPVLRVHETNPTPRPGRQPADKVWYRAPVGAPEGYASTEAINALRTTFEDTGWLSTLVWNTRNNYLGVPGHTFTGAQMRMVVEGFLAEIASLRADLHDQGEDRP